MARGEQTIPYPFRVGPFTGIAPATWGWYLNVVRGPATVGEAGTFYIIVEKGPYRPGPDGVPTDSRILPLLRIYPQYQDYRPETGPIRRVLYPWHSEGLASIPPPSRGVTGPGLPPLEPIPEGVIYEQERYSSEYTVAAGWVAVDFGFSQYVYGNLTDPTPYGHSEVYTPLGGGFTAYDGAIISYGSPDNPQLPGYTERLRGGVLTVEVRALNLQYVNDYESNVRVLLQDADGVIFSDETLFGRDGAQQSRNFFGSEDRRIARVEVQYFNTARFGSYSSNRVYYTAPAPESSGGGANVQHGGMVVAGVVTGGALRGFQSGIHQGFARSGRITGLLPGASTLTPSGGQAE